MATSPYRDTRETGRSRPGTPSRATGTDAEGFPILSATFKGILGRPSAGEMFSVGQDVSIAEQSTPSAAPNIFSAVEQQLGLKLESSTALLDYLIVDSFDREPTEN